ncbi:hypothetical protein J4558_18710 [Leptolyngbya sp. 15MV]|nr:hypothetical protein J4558_18710 [Leptolyngbya sp. 15MV]
MTDESPASDARQRILLVTGLSGAGKTTALRVLEDLGWEAIDNFPIRLLGRLIGRGGADAGRHPLAIGFDSRTRGFVPAEIIAKVGELAARGDLSVTTLFLDCAGAELERRYNETRRRHPMAQGRPVRTGIQAERELLEPLRQWADAVIDTSDYSSNDLQQAIRGQFAESAPHEMSVILSSFGFARGTPPLADLVFDMRFLDNPHWIPALRDQTGLDAEVGEHVRRDPAFAAAFDQIRALLRLLERGHRTRVDRAGPAERFGPAIVGIEPQFVDEFAELALRDGLLGREQRRSGAQVGRRGIGPPLDGGTDRLGPFAQARFLTLPLAALDREHAHRGHRRDQQEQRHRQRTGVDYQPVPDAVRARSPRPPFLSTRSVHPLNPKFLSCQALPP